MTRRRANRVAWMWSALAGISTLISSAVFFVACGGGRDVVPESHDVRADPKSNSNARDGYDYVARRPLGTVGLAEARGIAPDIAARAIDHLADQLDACERDMRSRDRFVAGAVRVVAVIDDRGAVEGVNVKTSDDKGGAANAILCVVAPVRLLLFPPADGDAGARGIAIEATWGAEQ